MQAADHEPENSTHYEKVVRLVKRLHTVADMRPGVLRRLEVAKLNL